MNFDKFLEAIEIMIDERIKGLKFCYVVDGTITEVIDGDAYTVNVFDSASILKPMNGQQYSVGDIVQVIVFNNNY